MAYTEIRYFSGYRDENRNLVQGDQIIETEIIEGPNAITDGYKRFKKIIESERIDWLLHASVKRDFEDCMTVDFVLRIGPTPYWSEDYLKQHSLGNYANNEQANSEQQS